MFVVYVTKMYDNLKMKEIDWSDSTLKDVTELIPTKENGQLHVFRRIPMSKEEGAPRVPSFIDFMKKTKLMVFHHLFIGGYGLAVISSWRGGLGDCVFSFMYMMEASTPFVSFRAVLSILGKKKTNLYLLNGLLMLLTFLIFRIIMLPVLLYKYSIIINMTFVSAILKLPLGCQISILALFIPQFYWFFLMIKIAVKVRNCC
jgi:TLC domain